MSTRPTRHERAEQIAAAISRFEQGATVADHDGRPIAENLGTEAGFGGTTASRRQQVQQYLQQYPDLRHRWKAARSALTDSAPRPPRDDAAALRDARAEAARLRAQVDALIRVADLHRRQAERLQRQADQQRAAQERRRATPEPDAPTQYPARLRSVPSTDRG